MSDKRINIEKLQKLIIKKRLFCDYAEHGHADECFTALETLGILPHADALMAGYRLRRESERGTE